MAKKKVNEKTDTVVPFTIGKTPVPPTIRPEEIKTEGGLADIYSGKKTKKYQHLTDNDMAMIEKLNTEIIKTGSESPDIIVHHEDKKFPWPKAKNLFIPKEPTNEGLLEEWISILRTQIEDVNGEQYMAEIQQNLETKDIRVVRI
jgi:hypothetical protein